MWGKLAIVSDKEPYTILRIAAQSTFLDRIDSTDTGRIGGIAVRLCEEVYKEEKKIEETNKKKESRYGLELTEA